MPHNYKHSAIEVEVSPEIQVLCQLLEINPKELVESFLADLGSSFGNGGSDERRKAKEYFLRTNAPHSAGFDFEQLQNLLDEIDNLPQDRKAEYKNNQWVENPSLREHRYDELRKLQSRWKKKKVN